MDSLRWGLIRFMSEELQELDSQNGDEVQIPYAEAINTL